MLALIRLGQGLRGLWVRCPHPCRATHTGLGPLLGQQETKTTALDLGIYPANPSKSPYCAALAYFTVCFPRDIFTCQIFNARIIAGTN